MSTELDLEDPMFLDLLVNGPAAPMTSMMEFPLCLVIHAEAIISVLYKAKNSIDVCLHYY